MIELRSLTRDDWPAVKAIYEAGIATRNATFETEALSWKEWDGGHLGGHRLVAEEGREILGWAALSRFSDRCCSTGVAEDSVWRDVVLLERRSALVGGPVPNPHPPTGLTRVAARSARSGNDIVAISSRQGRP